MLTLILFRHAKSSWDHPGLDDFDRPLSLRGEKAAPKMAVWLAEQNLVPDLVLCSSARRTRETLALALPAWKRQPRVDYEKALYLAVTPTLLAITRAVPDEARRLMIIGHNPGMQSFARYLAGSGKMKARQALAEKFPTAGVAVIAFEADRWAEIKLRSGCLTAFVTPKALGGMDN